MSQHAAKLTIAADSERLSSRTRRLLTSAATHAVLVVVAVTMLMPLLWLVSSSLKMPEQQYAWPPQLISWPLYTQNFVDLFDRLPMGTYLTNSFIVAVTSMIGMGFSCSLAAFALAQLRFRGRELIFSILLATMMVPYALTMIPTFTIMRALGWIDTLRPLIVPNWFGSAFMVFLLRQTYMSIPRDLMDAAKIDGANYFGIYWRIFLPLGAPMLVTVLILTFLYSWNDLLGPMIYLNSDSKYTIQLGLALLKGRAGTGLTQQGVIMAGSLVGVVPLLILYAFGQRYFIQGLARAGLKG